jgi:multiple sugar transport system substrate-binding protein
MRPRLGFTAVLAATALALAACGGEGGGARTLNFFIFNEPGGGPQQVARECSEQSRGRYRIEFRYLPSRADQQREQLVRRLGAEDDTIDLIGMDIIWTGEFANAGWLAPVPARIRGAVRENVFRPVLDTSEFEGRMYNVPIWSNTQLLWYRKDKIGSPPRTWADMVRAAERAGMTIQVQANRYEGLVVWTNAMIESAGTSILRGPDQIALAPGPTNTALQTMGRLGRSSAAPPDIDTSNEDSGRLGFEGGASAFMINYPFVYPSARDNAPAIFEQMRAAKYPQVVPGRESKPPLGGINIGVSGYSKKQDLAWEAVRCMVRPEHQTTIARMGGLPPVRRDLYARPAIREIYPGFAGLIRESIETAGPRPSESPAYQDLSLAIQRAIHPVTGISPTNAAPTYERLRDLVEQAVERRGLL